MKTIGERIAELRRARGLTQEQLGETIGVSAQTVSKWENSQTAPDISLLPVLAGVFEISIDTLFGQDEPRKDISFDEFPEICYDALLKAYAECWVSNSELSPLDKNKLIRQIRDDGTPTTGVAADTGASVLAWKDFACVTRAHGKEILPLLEEDRFGEFFSALARPSFRRVIRVLCEEENPTDRTKPFSFTAASLAKKCGLSLEETKTEIDALLRFSFVQIVEQTVDTGGEDPIAMYSRWGRGHAHLFLFPLLMISSRFLTNRNVWHCFRG